MRLDQMIKEADRAYAAIDAAIPVGVSFTDDSGNTASIESTEEDGDTWVFRSSDGTVTGRIPADEDPRVIAGMVYAHM